MGLLSNSLFALFGEIVHNLMFDFENLTVFNKAREFNKLIRIQLIRSSNLDNITRYQLSRAALSIMLNIAEGAGRFTKPDKRKFFIIARGSLFETTAILICLLDEKVISSSTYYRFYVLAEELSRMLYAMIRKLEKDK